MFVGARARGTKSRFHATSRHSGAATGRFSNKSRGDNMNFPYLKPASVD